MKKTLHAAGALLGLVILVNLCAVLPLKGASELSSLSNLLMICCAGMLYHIRKHKLPGVVLVSVAMAISGLGMMLRGSQLLSR